MSRTQSAHAAKRNAPPAQRAPRPGTRLRELWDLLHVYRGEVLEQSLSVDFHRMYIQQLKDFYGLDIRCFGRTKGHPGQGSNPGRWCLVGEWHGRHYHDYIAERLAKQEKPKMTMAPETLAALRGSIAKWRAIVDGTGTDQGTEDCPLCQLFHDIEEEDDDGNLINCSGCPVSEHTGNEECSGSPFSLWIRNTMHQGPIRRALTEQDKKYAQAELDFLISLLPEGEVP